MKLHDLLVRRLLALDLGLFNIAVIAFALLPPSTLTVQEWVAIVAAGLALLGVVSSACDSFTLPGERWAYMVTALAGAYVSLAYVHFAAREVPYWQVWPLILFLASGIASAAAAHVILGGPKGNV